MLSTWVNVAETCIGTGALGPGVRSVVWVQGCPLHCRGCIAPEWIPQKRARLVAPEALAAELLADEAVTGLTLSGGEPMLQAEALAATVRAARAHRDISVLCFTGYQLAELRRRPPAPGVTDLLGELDALIDGPYVAAANHGRGLRGSSNQVVHQLTGRLAAAGEALAQGPRTAEVRVRDQSLLLVGVPPLGLASGIDQAANEVRRLAEAGLSTAPERGGDQR